MPVSEMPLLERIARVLAGAAESSNADGVDPSAGEEVNMVWPEHVNQARAVLHTMREPDKAMAVAGDIEVWTRMVDAAIHGSADTRSALRKWGSEDVAPGAGTTGAE